MSTRTQYIVVEANSVEELRVGVNDKLKWGYICQGGVGMNSLYMNGNHYIHYAQAMIRIREDADE